MLTTSGIALTNTLIWDPPAPEMIRLSVQEIDAQSCDVLIIGIAKNEMPKARLADDSYSFVALFLSDISLKPIDVDTHVRMYCNLTWLLSFEF